MKLDMTAKWAWRKLAYYAAAALVAILGAFGVLSEVQVDQWTGELDKIIPYALEVIAPLLAGAKTHAGSDSTATAADVAAAQADPDDVADRVVAKMTAVDSYGQHSGRPPARQSVADQLRSLP